MSQPARLQLLGGLRLERDGPAGDAPVQRKRLALLAVVARAGAGGVSRERLLALLWPDQSPEEARHALDVALSALRRALPDGALTTLPVGLALDAARLPVDTTEFEAALARGDRAGAVARYRGPFLDGVALPGAPEFERWAEEERAVLGRRHVDALAALTAAAREAADPAGAVRWAHAWAAADPLGARAAVALVEALVAAGDLTGAARAAQAHGSLVRQELGMPPDPSVAAALDRASRAARAHVVAAVRDAEAEPAIHTVAEGPRRTSAPMAGVASSDQATAARAAVRAQTAPDGPSASVLPLGMSPGGLTRHRAGRGAGMVFAIAAALMLLAGTTVVRRYARAANAVPTPPVDARTVAVAPFRTGGADPALGYLREGMLDLLTAKLGSGAGLRATDARTLLAAWRRAAHADGADLPEAPALRVAQAIGAGRLVLGSVVGTPQRLVLTASLLGVPDGAVHAEATAEGPQDSLSVLVDRLAAHLLVREAGEGDRLGPLVGVPLSALKAYLDGQVAYRQGHFAAAYRQFDQALASDSTFALAALGLAMAAYWPEALGNAPRAVARAWPLRGRLSERDRLLLAALVEPPSTREALAAWRRALSAAPERAEPWFHLGDILFHWGPTLGVSDTRAQAAAAFRRAVELDSSFTPALNHLLQVALLEEDTAAVRRTARLYFARDSTSDDADYLRWHGAVVLGDLPRLAEIRARLDRLTPGALRGITGTGLQLASRYPGVLDDVDRAAAAFRRLPPSSASALSYFVLMNRGRPSLVPRTPGAPCCGAQRRQHVMEALYWDGDARAAAAVLPELARSAAAPLARAARLRGEQARDLCVLEQWRLRQGDTRTAARAIRALRSVAAGGADRAADATHARCAALLEAVLLSEEHHANARQALERLDSLVLHHGTGGIPEGNLVVARLSAAHGDVRRALAAVRRRPVQPYFGAVFLSSMLREEGRLAAAVGDTAGAIRAYRHYLALRSHPEPRLRADADRAQAELARLERPRRAPVVAWRSGPANRVGRPGL